MFSWFGPKAMRAMLSISRTYENTADYKIQTHSERSLGRYEMSHAPKTEQSELSLFFAEVAVSVRSGARSERVRCRAERAPPDSPTLADTATSQSQAVPPPREVGVYLTGRSL